MSNFKDNLDNSLRQIYEGQLSKYTNLMKGWQNRWFVLDPLTGMLEYFMTEGEKKQRPRSSLHLAGAIVVPSEEDSFTFTVNAANAESFKLRAVDAKERQYWITRLRVVAQAHTQVMAESNPPLFRDHPQLCAALSAASVSSCNTQVNTTQPTKKILTCNLTVLDAFSSVRDYLRRVECEHQRLVHHIEDLPLSGIKVTSIDTELLLLKATSQATLLCLEQCLAILHYQQQQPNKPQASRINSASTSPMLFRPVTAIATPSRPEKIKSNEFAPPVVTGSPQVNSGIVDNEDEYVVAEESDQGSARVAASEEYQSRTLLLLSQLKLGTELTRTTLPVVYCESRSLLQVIADAFSQPQLLLQVAEEAGAEQRMVKVVQWYLQCIRCLRLEMTAARKPLNPILGETLKCIWPCSNEKSGSSVTFRFVAEQVSHHPPVSAFVLQCGDKIQVRGHVSIKAKLMGMYVGTSLGGDLILELNECNEKYELGYPSLFVRSILAEPWMEFGGRVSLQCPESKVSANIVFQTKPFYGGKAHQVTAEMKNSSGNVFCKAHGDWNSHLECIWNGGVKTELIQLAAQAGPLRKVRPFQWLAENESSKLWLPLQQALNRADIQLAGEIKKSIEDKQRQQERQRSINDGVPFQAKHFRLEKDAWLCRRLDFSN